MTSDPVGAPAPDPVREVFRTAVRDVLVLTAALTVVGAVVGALVSGAPGLWGGLVGGLVVLVAAATTPVTMLRTAGAPLTTAMAAAAAGWFVKTAIVLVAVLVLRGTDVLDKRVLALVVVVGLLGSVVLDGRAVQRGRVPYVTPAADGGTDDGDESD